MVLRSAVSELLGSILNSQVSPWTYWIRIFILTRSSRDLYTQSIWKRHVLAHTFSLSSPSCSDLFYSSCRIVLSISDKKISLQKKKGKNKLLVFISIISSNSNLLRVNFFQLSDVVWVFNTCLNSQAPTLCLLIYVYWASYVASKNISSRASVNALIGPALVYCWAGVNIW